MTAITEQPFSVILDEDDDVVEGKLRGIDAGPTWAKHRVVIELDDADTSGHAFDRTSIAISLHFDDDVEGHALSLHFPSAGQAEAFRRRMIATGALAGALVVGVTAAQLTASAPTARTAPAAPIVAPAPAAAQPLVNPRIPAEDLAPAPAAAQPLVNPRIPAEDLAPAVDPAAPLGPPAVNPRAR